MAEVFIESLVIENFGPYYGRHEFKFTSLEDRGMIVIGAKNGAGKTHLWRAAFLALLGESGPGELRKVEATVEGAAFQFDQSFNRKAAAEGEKIMCLELTLAQPDIGSGGVRRLTLKRKITFRPHSPPDWQSFVPEAGQDFKVEAESLQKLRDAFVPWHMARFFFLDSEHSHSLKLGQQEAVEGVSRVLGLWSHGEVERCLRHLLYRNIPRQYHATSPAGPMLWLAEIAGSVVRAQGQLEAKAKETEALQTELAQRKRELEQVEEALKQLGAAAPEDLKAARQQREELATRKAELEGRLRDAWELAIPVGLLGKFGKELHQDLLEEEKRREWESGKAGVEPKLPHIQEAVFEGAAAEFALRPEAKAYYSGRLAQALESSLLAPPPGLRQAPFYLARSKEESQRVRSLLETGQRQWQALPGICAELKRLREELRQSDERLEALQSDREGLKRSHELHARRGETSGRIEQLLGRLKELAGERERLTQELAQLKPREQEQRLKLEQAEEGQSLAGLAGSYREMAGAVRSQQAIRLRQAVGRATGELWLDIMGREREFTGMDFDEGWNCFLVRRDGRRVAWEQINPSAGQRQVRMLAFYEALRQLALLVPPLLVDTPLARLDAEVRESVLQRLYLRGHQTILLTTNAEIDPHGPLFESIRDRLARVYTLHPDGQPDSTFYEVRVSGDYFGRQV